VRADETLGEPTGGAPLAGTSGQSTDAPARRDRTLRDVTLGRVAVDFGAIAATIVLFVVYLRLSRNVAVNADGSSQALKELYSPLARSRTR
jgi:hypothetical protein